VHVSLDAIVVLGCPLAPRGVLEGAAKRRVRRATTAFHEGLAPSIVASGGRRWYGIAEAQAYQRALAADNVPGARIIMELSSQTTAENAAFVAAIFRERDWQRAALVTCDWHMARALILFRRAGIECVATPATSPWAPLWVRVYRRLRERVSLYLQPGGSA
jgi:uncharacterized SAM-binding protein YcdF (DUF218 family)